MSTLFDRTIAESYTELLKTSATGGVTSALTVVEDGDATASALQISTLMVRSSGNLEVVGTSTLTGNVSLGGELTVAGNTVVQGNLTSSGGTINNTTLGATTPASAVFTTVAVNNTTQSTTKDNGALVVEGGVGVEKNVNIGGNVVITGNLQVSGTSVLADPISAPTNIYWDV